MIFHRSVLAVVVSGVLFASCASHLSAGELLRWKFTEGQKFHVTVEQSTETTTEVNKKQIVMSLEMTMDMDWTIEKVDADQTAKLSQVFTRLAMKARMPGAKMVEFDSASEKEPTAAAASIAAGVRPLLGTRFQLSMTELGEIQNVQVNDEELAVAFANASAAKLKDVFSKESITKTLRQALLKLPKDELSAGATWTESSSTTTPLGEVKQDAKYTLVGNDEETGLKRIQVATALTLTPSGKSQLKQHASTGERLFDNAVGRLTSSETKQHLLTESSYRETKILVSTKTHVKMSMQEK